MTCEHCRQQLLPFLYELLDPLDREQTAVHVKSCPECQSALLTAREQQGMLAEAVKEEHPEIVFKAPSKATPASSAPTVIMQRPRRRFFPLNRWAAAASILLVLCAGGAFGAWTLWRGPASDLELARYKLAKAKEDLTKTQNELTGKKGQTQKEIHAIQKEIDTLLNSWNQDVERTPKKGDQQGARLNLKGPQVAVAGARNSYEVHVVQNFAPAPQDKGKDGIKQQQQVPMQTMQLRAYNQRTQETLYEQKLQVQPNNKANFDLPAKLPIKPGEEIALEFLIEIDGKMITLTDSLKLVAPEYITHLATDRPLYRPGDTVRFRSLTLERFSLKPAEEKFHLRYRIVGPNNAEIFNQEVAGAKMNLAGPSNEAIYGPDNDALNCLGAGEFALPKDLPVGQYTLYVNEVNERFNEEKRTFLVNRWTPPRFSKELKFNRSSYGARDLVKMQASVVPLKAAAGDPISVTVRLVVDNNEVFKGTEKVDRDGRVSFECELPKLFHKGIGTVTLECDDGSGTVEKLTRELPLFVRNVQVDFYPEGGDLIADVQNRVYFQARTPANRPADIRGRIVNDKSEVVAQVQTVSDDKEPGINQGLGVFSFIPETGRLYKLVIDSPIGIERPFSLPKAKPVGVIMTTPQLVADNEIQIELMSVKERRILLVGAYCRGRLLDHKVVRAGAQQPIGVTLKPNVDVGGVYRITVFEMTGTLEDIAFNPLAERLIYRKSSARVDVSVSSSRAAYQPGDKVLLKLEARNEKKVRVPALAMIAVVDAGVLKLADEKTARGLPTHFLLTNEVKSPEDLEHSDVLLGDHPKASMALDLLLGTQGWRRFAEQNPQKFIEKQNNNEAKNPNFLANTAVVTQVIESEQKQIDQLDQRYVKTWMTQQKKLAATEKDEAGPAELQAALASQQSNVQLADQEVAQVNRRLAEVRIFLIQFVLGAGLLVLLVIGFVLIRVGLRKLSEGTGKPRRWLTAGLVLHGGLFLISAVGTFAFMGERFFDDLRQDDGGFKLNVNMWGNGGEGQNVPPGGPPQILLPEPVEPDADDDRPIEKLKMARVNAEAVNKVKAGVPMPLPFNNFAPHANAGNVLFNALDPQEEERRLRQEGQYQALLLKQVGRRVQLPEVNDPSVVRVFAHKHPVRVGAAPADSTATIYWHPVLVMPDGTGEVHFDLTDAVTRFEVLVHSHTFDGRLGTNRAEIVAQLPFSAKVTVPAEVSSQDRITLPLEINNELAAKLDVALSGKAKGLEFLNESERRLTLEPGARKRSTFEFKPSLAQGDASLRIVGKANGSTGIVERRIKIVPDGFPVTRSISGVLEKDTVEHEITLPATWVPGSLQVEAHFYPTPLAELQAAQNDLDQLLQKSQAKQMPAVLMLQYMKAHADRANPILEKEMWKNLHASKSGPGAVADLLFLNELAPVSKDAGDSLEHEKLLERIAELGVRHADPLADAISVWSSTERGDDFDRDLASMRKRGETSKDPAFLALAALSHFNAKRTDDGVFLAQQLAKLQKETGAVTGAALGVSGAQGRDREVETTALAVLAWLKADRREFDANLTSAVGWLHQQRRGAGSFGGPHATALALKALLAHQHKSPRTVQGGEVSLTARNPKGGSFSKSVKFTPRSFDPVTLAVEPIATILPGKNKITLGVSANNALPYTLTWSYRIKDAQNDPKAPVKLSTKLSAEEAGEGDTVKLTAVVTSASDKVQATVAVLGLPAGLTVPDGAAQLKKLQADGKIAAWESRGRELILSFRDLAAGAKVELELDLTCRFPGTYRGPASQVHPTTDSERVFWADSLNIRILPAK